MALASAVGEPLGLERAESSRIRQNVDLRFSESRSRHTPFSISIASVSRCASCSACLGRGRADLDEHGRMLLLDFLVALTWLVILGLCGIGF